MSVPRRRAQSGYTLVEIMLVVAISVLALTVTVAVFTSTSRLATTSRVHLRMASEHRRNLEMLANTLRGADMGTLGGFDAMGVATAPSFSRVTGAGTASRTYAEPERLVWRAAARAVNGVDDAGAIYSTGPAGDRLMADRVPRDGFLVRLQGNSLVIRLTTYYATTSDTTATITSETSVSLRN